MTHRIMPGAVGSTTFKEGVNSGAAQITGINGIATLGNWSLGSAVGTNTISATSVGLAGSPLTIAVTGISGSATQLALSGGSTTAIVSSPLATPPSVIVKDVNGNPVAAQWQILTGHIVFIIVLIVKPDGLFPRIKD